jgi:hypothetical protein
MLDRDGQTIEIPETWATQDIEYDESWIQNNDYPAEDPRSKYTGHQLAFRNLIMENRYTCICAGRRQGKDFTLMGVTTETCFKTPGTRWLVAAPSERQSRLSLQQAKDMWIPAWNCVVEDVIEQKEGIHPESLVKSLEVKIYNPLWPKGSKASSIVAVPGRPDTVRGDGANVATTEADFFDDPQATNKALFFMIANPHGGGAGQKRIVHLSTPNGKNGLLWSIGGETWNEMASGIRMKQKGKAQWALLKSPLTERIAASLGIDLEELRDALADDEAWAQEALCQFLDGSLVWMPYELIAALENDSASMVAGDDWYTTPQPHSRVAGLDFGRKKDLTVFMAGDALGDYLNTKDLVTLENMPVWKQVEILQWRIQHCDAVEVDYTGPGIGIGDELVRLFGEWKPEAGEYGKICLNTFSARWKMENFSATKRRAEQRMLGLPRNRDLREDLHSVYRTTTPTGMVTFAAPHLAHGHSDRATALVLMDKAARRPVMSGFGFHSLPGGSILQRAANLFGFGGGKPSHGGGRPIKL